MKKLYFGAVKLLPFYFQYVPFSKRINLLTKVYKRVCGACLSKIKLKSEGLLNYLLYKELREALS